MKAEGSVANIDEYIAAFPADVQKVLEKIRATIQKAVPAAVETISYRMPTFKFNDRILIHFAAFKHHIGIFPPATGDAKLMRDIAKYAGPKGNLQLPLDEPIPYELIRRVVKFKQAEILAKTKTGRQR